MPALGLHGVELRSPHFLGQSLAEAPAEFLLRGPSRRGVGGVDLAGRFGKALGRHWFYLVKNLRLAQLLEPAAQVATQANGPRLVAVAQRTAIGVVEVGSIAEEPLKYHYRRCLGRDPGLVAVNVPVVVLADRLADTTRASVVARAV